MSETERVEELTLRLLDDEASAGEVEELENIIAADERAEEVHVALVEQEAVLRGGRKGIDLSEAVLARVRRALGERVEKGVMQEIRARRSVSNGSGPHLPGQRPEEGRSAPVDMQPVVQERRWVGSTGFWLASAAAAAIIVAVVGVWAARVAPRRARPGSVEKGPSVPAARPAGKLVDLKIELPRPAFIGTPKNITTPNLEPPKGDKPRPPFGVPVGTRSLAFKKPVTASDEDPIIGEIDQVTDGDKEAGDGSYVELGPGLQHVQVDLEAEYDIHAILVWHYHGDPRVYCDVVVQVADDPDFITGVKAVYNNDHDNSSGLGIGRHYEYFETHEGRLIDAKGVKARYVRLYSNGSTADEMNRYTEVEVYGKPATGGR